MTEKGWLLSLNWEKGKPHNFFSEHQLLFSFATAIKRLDEHEGMETRRAWPD